MTDNPEPPLAGTRYLTELLGMNPPDLLSLAPEDSNDRGAALLAAWTVVHLDETHKDLLQQLQWLRTALPAPEVPLHDLDEHALAAITDRASGIGAAATRLTAARQHLNTVLAMLRPQLNQLIAERAEPQAPTTSTNTRFTAARMTMTSQPTSTQDRPHGR